MQSCPSSTEVLRIATAAAVRPIAFRVLVRDGADAADGDGLVVTEPRAARLVFEEADIEGALALPDDPGGATDGETMTTLVFLPSGAQTPFELQRRAEQWMGSRRGEVGAPYEVPYRSDRILWRHGRAVCFGVGEFFDDIRHAVAYFSFCERELARLETRIAASWPAMEKDLALTHSITHRELRLQRAVDERTREAHGMRMGFIRLETALERLDRVLSAPAQRIVSELAQQADTIDRLRLLGDAIEMAQEVYDTANDRLLEYRYFRSEYIIEIVIAAVLLVELIVVGLDIWQR
jgi:hypothetical protein